MTAAAGADGRDATLAALVLRRTVELAGIPAPTGAEGKRASVVRRWWDDDGWAARIDSVGNVWGQVAGGPGPALLVAAHLDTVFPADLPHGAVATPGRLTGPSVGDDSVGVAALSAAALLAGPGPGALWLVATVGEEGMGNLAGIRHALAHAPRPLSAVIAVEGNYLGRVVITGVGSIRWRVRYRGPGGHAWERSGAPSAVHAAAEAAARIAGLTVPGARCTVNIGSIGGGEAINARARDAWFEADLRADTAAALRQLADGATAILTAAAGPGLDVGVAELGRRPAGGVAPSSPLAKAACGALARAGIECAFSAASTDANAAYEAGIPAVALGVTRGEGEHTPGEWIETAPVAAGLAALAGTIAVLRKERG
jgi:tripeptide aminopeptidase